jgi:hypothetical protein
MLYSKLPPRKSATIVQVFTPQISAQLLVMFMGENGRSLEGS